MIDLNFADEIPLDQTTMVDSYHNLPGGGQYHERDDGTWYETPEGDWWWQHPDGKFEKV